jgi:hypothetical protein
MVPLHNGLSGQLGDALEPFVGEVLSVPLAYFAPPIALAVVIYALLSERERRLRAETCCRKCDYILRGISEPRCPECGERK